MKTRFRSARIAHLVVSASLLGLAAACNRQPAPSPTAAPTVAPPAAALPLAAAASPAAPAPPVAALPPPPSQIAYAPQPASQGYQYIDQAYAMGTAFADTPPDYAVDYQGTRPWIWRAGNGAYRIVERLPQGERDYYYYPGQDQPFLVRDPNYSYAYDNGALAAVYGPDGAEIHGPAAARRADEASRYLYRARDLRRAAQDQPRQSAYAANWAKRRNDLQSEKLAWQQQQASNADWRAWHDQHGADEARQWRQEQDQRAAYAAAIGVAATSLARTAAPQPNPAEVARRQASYFSKWDAAHGRAPAARAIASRAGAGGAVKTPVVAPPVAAKGALAPAPRAANVQLAQAKAAQAKAAQANAAQAKAAQAAHAQQLAAAAKQRQAAAVQAKAAQTAHAQQLAAQAKQRDAEAAQARAAQAKTARAKAAQSKAAQAKAAQAAHAQQLAAA
ncbi:MAG TPA: hypothetical protein VE221_00560, partial [Sphingomicrobium sp.]|nr:hypothetical protein [Sphingomicrobium sp.]